VGASEARPLERPATLMGDLRRLSASLVSMIEQARWVVWRWERDVRRRKWTKVPYQAERPQRRASSKDPATWSTHEAAVALVERGEADGIGYQLADGEIGAFDLDHCRDPQTGEIASWARTLVDEAQSYTEVTVSGTGLRIIGLTRGSEIHRKFPIGTGSLEVYRRARRFIVVTGLPLEDGFRDLAELDGVMDALVARQAAASAGLQNAAALDLDCLPNADACFVDLPADLVSLVLRGAPEGQRSDQFHHTVGWLKDYGWTRDSIVELLERYPVGIAAKYAGRVRAEVERSFGKVGASGVAESTKASTAGIAPIPLHWHGDPDDTAERKWLVVETIPETGKGLLSGQWGTGKTFVALDLAGAVMTGTTFAGRAALRRGGVLFIAAEGASEVSIRLRGVVQSKLKDQASIDPAKLERLPFAWMDECPALTSREALPILKATIAAAAARMRAEFDLKLALIVIDTLMAAADFEDENDAAQGQKVMRALEDLSRSSGAFALAVDHFGKAVETGTRGTSAKEGAADVVLALLGDKDMAGKVSNRRLAIRKLRGGATGAEIPFRLSPVTIDPKKAFLPTTTCVVVWNDLLATASQRPQKERWPRSLRVFKAALLETIIVHGNDERPFGSEGPTIRAAPLQIVRAEFVKSYPATGSDNPSKQADAKRRAFDRAVRDAAERQLAVTREVRGVDYIWATIDEPTDRTSTPDRQDTS
jgi:hypothetical protein